MAPVPQGSRLDGTETKGSIETDPEAGRRQIAGVGLVEAE